MMCRKHGKHEGDGADDNTGIILLLTCFRGYTMFILQLDIFTRVWRNTEYSANLLRRQQ